MALTPLGQIYERSTPAFDQKLAGVVQIFQGFKNTQLQKQQLEQQFEMRKEMVDYEYEKRGELAEQQAGVKAMQDYQKNLKESFEQTQKTLTDYTKFVTTDNASANKYGLSNFSFDLVPTTDVSGMPTGASIGISENGREYDPLTFRAEVERRNEFAQDFLDELDSGNMTLGDSMVKEVTGADGNTYQIQTIGKDNVGQVMNDIRRSPEMAMKYYNMYSTFGAENLLSRVGDVDEQRTPQAGRDVIPVINQMRQDLGGNTIKQYGVTEKQTFLGMDWLNPDEPVVKAVDYSKPIGDIRSDISSIISKTVLGDEEYDFTTLNPAIKTAMVTGNVEALKNVTDQRTKELFEVVQSDEQLKQLIKHSVIVDNIYSRLGSVAGVTATPESVYINWNNIPKDISQITDFKKIYSEVPISFNMNRSALATLGLDL